MTSPSNFKSNHIRAKSKNSKQLQKNQFTLDIPYDAEQLNETNLVSSNNVTSRELSQRQTKNNIKSQNQRAGYSLNAKKKFLVNQTSMDPNIDLMKSPEFPQKQIKKTESKPKIETIPFHNSRGFYKTQSSLTKIKTPKTPYQNSKTIKNIKQDLPRKTPKSIKKIVKRAKSRPLSRGSVNHKERASVNIGKENLSKELYKKHHRSFQKNKRGHMEVLKRNRKRALSSKEILFGSGLGQGVNLKNLRGMNELYHPLGGPNEKVQLIYVDKSDGSKVF
jgi:hypothetical protein